MTTNIRTAAMRATTLFAFSLVTAVTWAGIDPADEGALWVAGSKGLYNVSAASASVETAALLGEGIQDVTVSLVEPAAWAYGDKTLFRVDPADGSVAAFALPRAAAGGDPTGFAADGANDTVWIALGDVLYRLDAASGAITAAGFGSGIPSLALDHRTGTLWVALEYEVLQLANDGSILSVTAAPTETTGNGRGRGTTSPAILQAISFDPQQGSVLLLSRAALYRLDPAAGFSTIAALPEALRAEGAALSADGAGGAWVWSQQDAAHVGADGTLLVSLEPFAGDPRPVIEDLDADPITGGAWVANDRRFRELDVGGTVLGEGAIPPQAGGVSKIARLSLFTDVDAPTISITVPEDGAVLRTASPALSVEYTDEGTGVDPDSLVWASDGDGIGTSCSDTGVGADCQLVAPLPDGPQVLSALVLDDFGNAATDAITVTVDTMPPEITVTEPSDGSITNQRSIGIAGSLSERADLTLDGDPVVVGLDLGFSTIADLIEGANTLALVATDRAGNVGSAAVTVTLDTVAPAAPDLGGVAFEDQGDGTYTVSAPAGSVEPNATVRLTNLTTGESVLVTADATGAFLAPIAGSGGAEIQVEVIDAAGNIGAPGSTTVPGGNGGLPPDPSLVAPPLDPYAFTPFIDAVSFLYAGANPIQFDVVPGTIEARRVAVIRGLVMDGEGQPLPGATVSVKDHPEYGYTLSRADGMFDMAVNGGGTLTLEYAQDGRLPAHRIIELPWRDYAIAPDVALIALDPVTTEINFGTTTTPQVASSSMVSELSDGEALDRQLKAVFPTGVQASMQLPDGTWQTLSTGTFRATEYTTNRYGAQRMPAELPPNTAYTYAVELSFDEAIAAGAERVEFSEPVPFYVDNFLEFPTGAVIPMGYYDRGLGAWVAMDSGVVIEILGVDATGHAELDSDGDGVADDQVRLDELGITPSEQIELAGLYAAGAAIWRASTTHFTAHDLNLASLLQDFVDLGYNIRSGGDPAADLDTADQAECSGCQIHAQTQVVGEEIPLVGTPYSLNYASDRVPGRGTGRLLRARAFEGEIPPNTIMINVQFLVAGRALNTTVLGPVAGGDPLQSPDVERLWDGLDIYGRSVNGTVPVTVNLSYHYVTRYGAAPERGDRDFGQFSETGVSTEVRSLWGYRGIIPEDIFDGLLLHALNYDIAPPVIQVTRREFTQATAYGVNADLSGWSLSPHHRYDPQSDILYLGNGDRRTVGALARIIGTIAGSGAASFAGDGGPAAAADLNQPSDVAVGPDGSIYVADARNYRIRRIDPDGTITTIAGTGPATVATGDGGPATSATFNIPDDIALGPDGSVYFSDPANRNVRRIRPDGIIETAAGNGGTCNGDP
ncbi:MAG TPA: hypothetical protein VGA66_05175, partial [Mycobacterium sp.]